MKAWSFIIVDALMRVVFISGNTVQRYSARNELLPFPPKAVNCYRGQPECGACALGGNACGYDP